MGLLVNIVAADEGEVEDIAASAHPVDDWSGIEAREIDSAKLATLHCLLTGDDFDEAMDACERVLAAGDDGSLVLRFPGEAATKLAELEEDALERVGEELAASEEFERHDWPVEQVQALIVELGELARIAESQGQELFVWMHPLLT